MARFVLKCCEAGISRAVHDISDGGMILAAAEMAIASRPDARRGIVFDTEALDPVVLYSESPGYLIEMSQESWDAIESKPDFLSVTGRVTEEFCIAAPRWRMDLREILEEHTNRLDRIIWREEVTE
jgi:phosphoribosylformylglycinamidine (FGAM) synthase-like enzyme